VRDLERVEQAFDDLIDDPAAAPRWSLAWFGWIPTRRYDFGEGLVVLAPLIGR
jgi:hypothetical protein